MKGMQEMDSHGHLRSECIVFHPPLKDKGEFTKQLVFKLISSSYPGYQVIVQAIISSRGPRQHTFQQPFYCEMAALDRLGAGSAQNRKLLN